MFSEQYTLVLFSSSFLEDKRRKDVEIIFFDIDDVHFWIISFRFPLS